VLALVHGDLIGHQIAVKTDLDRDLAPVRADRVQLQQVILNLITNAVEAMSLVDVRQRFLTVSTRPQERDGVMIRVQDSGPGIDPGGKERIFDAFFSTKSSGMGMGLFICRSIVEAHGGHLWATTAETGGAVFNLVLPVGQPAADEVVPS